MFTDTLDTNDSIAIRKYDFQSEFCHSEISITQTRRHTHTRTPGRKREQSVGAENLQTTTTKQHRQRRLRKIDS